MKANYEDLIGFMLEYLCKCSESKSVINCQQLFDVDGKYVGIVINCAIKLNGCVYYIVRDVLCGDTWVHFNDNMNFIVDYPIGYQKKIYNAFYKQIVLPLLEKD